jgi:hypothetical protein
MAEFCKCGSIKIKGNCTNKNCGQHESKARKIERLKDMTNWETLKKLIEDGEENRYDRE